MGGGLLNGLLRLFLFVVLANFAAHADDEFPIGPGDEISIRVYNEPDLSVEGKIPKSGKLSIPLLGELAVSGMKVSQLSAELEKRYLDGYLVAPSVSVTVNRYRPFFIRGAVNSAGSYDFMVDLTVDKAIAIAGGLKDRASQNEWFIIRGKSQSRFKVAKDALVFPGDTIEIEESLF